MKMSLGEKSLLQGVIESIDHTDPTNSREEKPSLRMRRQAKDRGFTRTIVVGVLKIVAFVAAYIIIRGVLQ